jgi:hypothetical protein
MSLPSSPVVKEQPGIKIADTKPKFIPSSIDRKLSASLLERSGSSSGTAGSKGVVAKMNFLDGFRQTLRPRTKSDDFGDEGGFFKLEATTTSTTTTTTSTTTAAKTALTSSSNKQYLESSLSSGGGSCTSGNGQSEKVGVGLIRRWSETTSSSGKNPVGEQVGFSSQDKFPSSEKR